jgi:hypothetical protein
MGDESSIIWRYQIASPMGIIHVHVCNKPVQCANRANRWELPPSFNRLFAALKPKKRAARATLLPLMRPTKENQMIRLNGCFRGNDARGSGGPEDWFTECLRRHGPEKCRNQLESQGLQIEA